MRRRSTLVPTVDPRWLACALIAACGAARATQPEPPPPAIDAGQADKATEPSEAAQPEVAQVPAPAHASELLARLQATYRAGGVAQKGSITLDELPQLAADAASAKEPADRARVRSRWSPIAFSLAPAADSQPPVASVRLGAALLMEVSTSALRIVHVANSSIYYLSEFAHEPDAAPATPLARLERVLPPVPLPPLAWALSGNPAARDEARAEAVGEDDADVPLEPADASGGFWSLDHVRWDDAIVRKPGGELIITGVGQSGPVELAADGDRFTLRRLTIVLGPPDMAVRLTLTLDQTADAARLALPDLSQRTRVASIAELRSRLPEIPVGSRLPSLALMGAGLSAWSLDSAIQAVAPPPALAGTMAPARAVMILYTVDDRDPEATLAPARAAARVATELAQEFQRRSAQGSRSLPPMLVAAAVVSEVGQIDGNTLESAAKAWAAGPAPEGVTLLASSGGTQLLSRLLPGANALAVVVDHELTVLGKVQLDGGRDADSVAAALRDLLEPGD